MTISIVIPAHNEERRIGKTLEEYVKYFREKKREKEIKSFEIIVVLNGCEDNTLQVVKKIKKRFREIKILDFERAGKGFAIIEGFKDALIRENNLIGFVDADMATPPKAFYGLIRNIQGYEGVIANRWDKRSIIKTKQPFLRRVMSRGYNFIARSLFLFSFRDTQCGAKVLTRDLAFAFE